MNAYGDRLMRDYGDWAGFDEPFANARREYRAQIMQARRDELVDKFDAIHGHFLADKYVDMFDDAEFIAFFRDPYQQTIAHYSYLRRNTRRLSDVNRFRHPEIDLFLEYNPTLLEYIEMPMYRDHQSQFLGSLDVEDLAFVGLSEEYDTSLELMSEHFGLDLGNPLYANVNNEREGLFYPVDAEVRAAVRKYRARDLEMHARAKEMFERHAARLAA